MSFDSMSSNLNALHTSPRSAKTASALSPGAAQPTGSPLASTAKWSVSGDHDKENVEPFTGVPANVYRRATGKAAFKRRALADITDEIVPRAAAPAAAATSVGNGAAEMDSAAVAKKAMRFTKGKNSARVLEESKENAVNVMHGAASRRVLV